MLIVISGIDGSGKSLQVKMLEQWYTQQGIAVSIVKAYDDQAKMICRPFMESWCNETAIMFLFQALHAEQYSAAMKALALGDVVIADRWDESYLSYHQNFGELASRAQLRNELNDMAFHRKLPDKGFLINVPPEIARQRRSSRGKMERFEDRPDQYFQRIQETYLSIASQRGWWVLDGTKTPDVLHHQIIDALAATRTKQICTP